MRQWKCTVCGYIHTGDEPPEKCPVCGADRSKFVEIENKEPATNDAGVRQIETKNNTGTGTNFSIKLMNLITRSHVHPISVHIPNGVLPLSVLFIFLSAAIRSEGLETTAFYNMMFVVLAMPVVLASGIVDWKNRYKGAVNRIFISKMICGGLVLLFSASIVGWRIINPDVAGPESSSRWTFVGAHLLALVPAVFAGYLGGKLVFKEKG